MLTLAFSSKCCCRCCFTDLPAWCLVDIHQSTMNNLLMFPVGFFQEIWEGLVQNVERDMGDNNIVLILVLWGLSQCRTFLWRWTLPTVIDKINKKELLIVCALTIAGDALVCWEMWEYNTNKNKPRMVGIIFFQDVFPPHFYWTIMIFL